MGFFHQDLNEIQQWHINFSCERLIWLKLCLTSDLWQNHFVLITIRNLSSPHDFENWFQKVPGENNCSSDQSFSLTMRNPWKFSSEQSAYSHTNVNGHRKGGSLAMDGCCQLNRTAYYSRWLVPVMAVMGRRRLHCQICHPFRSPLIARWFTALQQKVCFHRGPDQSHDRFYRFLLWEMDKAWINPEPKGSERISSFAGIFPNLGSITLGSATMILKSGFRRCRPQ